MLWLTEGRGRVQALTTVMITMAPDRPPLRASTQIEPCQAAGPRVWTIFMIFLWVIWFWVLITIFIDLFRSHDQSGWVKALWFIFILLLPLIGSWCT